MSEHEDFCVPLIEAMCFDMPIVAYASSAVPDTMGAGGVLVSEKDYAKIVIIMHELLTNSRKRELLKSAQKERLLELQEDVIVDKLLEVIGLCRLNDNNDSI